MVPNFIQGTVNKKRSHDCFSSHLLSQHKRLLPVCLNRIELIDAGTKLKSIQGEYGDKFMAHDRKRMCAILA